MNTTGWLKGLQVTADGTGIVSHAGVALAATHPDRPDGGDPARYAAASAAYGQLRTAWGRSEAYADLASAAPPYLPAPASSRPSPPGARIAGALVLVPARIRHGRPWRMLLRAIVAAVLSLLVLHLIPGQPSGPAVVTGLITWFVLTARGIWPRRRAGDKTDASGGGLRLGDRGPPGQAAARGGAEGLPVTASQAGNALTRIKKGPRHRKREGSKWRVIHRVGLIR